MRGDLRTVGLNPVLLREVRARWRKWPTFAIVFGYAILLAIAIGWLFLDVASGATVGDREAGRTAMLGYQLFVKLSWLQALGWMLLAPVLAAPAIAGEREQGLMDSLYLSSLTPREILRGKLQSMLWFIGLMLLVPLPVIALCFQMGGVSPQEFFLVMSLNATTALTGVALGLHDSAHARTTGEALRAVFYHLGLWFGSSLFCCVGVFVSPIPALVMLLEGDSIGSSIGWVGFTMLCQCAMTARLLTLAQRALLRPLAEAEPANPGYIAPATPAYQIPMKEFAGMVTAPTVWTNPADFRLYGENYFFSRLRTGNAILQFELSRRLRIRSAVVADLYNALMIIAICYSMWLGVVLFMAGSARTPLLDIWKIGVMVLLTLGVLGGAVMGSTTFSRDREQLMLEPIMLSSLSNATIIGAKLGAILIVCLAHSVVVWPVLLPCIRSFTLTGVPVRGVSLGQAATAGMIIALSVAAATLFGMSVSWLCRRSFVATGWALALLFAFSAWSTLVSPPTGPAAQDAVSHWHPFYALIAVAHNELGQGIACIAVLALVNAVLLLFLHREMRNRARIRDKKWQRIPNTSVVPGDHD